MEWVETTGKTIAEAKETALDELGVDEQDAEFEVLEEPKLGLFGRLRSEGRIRARVRPTTPRAKDDRRDRRRRSKGNDAKASEAATANDAASDPTAAASRDTAAAGDSGSGGTGERAARPSRPARAPRSRTAPAASAPTRASGDGTPASSETSETSVSDRPRTNPSRRRGGRGGTRPDAGGTTTPPAVEPAAAVGDAAVGQAAASQAAAGQTAASQTAAGQTPASQTGAAEGGRGRNGSGDGGRSGRGRRRSSGSRSSAASTDDGLDAGEGTLMDVALDEQGKVAEEFLVGLLGSFGVTGQVDVTVPDDDTIDIQVNGDDLGLLIGPKGSTLLAIQDITRTVVQRKTSAGNGRIFIDVSGYRMKRNEALARFAHKVADDVIASQTRVAMEPMSAPDRKTVHDTITDIDGVETISEGEDAQRHVVVLPSQV
jgi:predicted RNA-binding protein Jag